MLVQYGSFTASTLQLSSSTGRKHPPNINTKPLRLWLAGSWTALMDLQHAHGAWLAATKSVANSIGTAFPDSTSGRHHRIRMPKASRPLARYAKFSGTKRYGSAAVRICQLYLSAVPRLPHWPQLPRRQGTAGAERPAGIWPKGKGNPLDMWPASLVLLLRLVLLKCG